jgi:mono/diheme cytochrome c family protein
MNKLAIPLLITAIGVMGARNLTGAGSPSGKEIFEDSKCTKCHTIESQGLERAGAKPPGKLPPDLSGVGLKHSTEWMQQWLLKEVEQNGKKHLKKFTGSEAELKTLTTWLSTLRKKS